MAENVANRVRIFDTTLRDGEQAANINLNVAEKLQLAKQPAAIGVSTPSKPASPPPAAPPTRRPRRR